MLWDIDTLCVDVFAMMVFKKKPNGQKLGRRYRWNLGKKTEEEESRHTGDAKRHGEETEGTR